ncbi:MAG: HDOD domain-containing protein [Planctomycetota bacterium]|jgi:HD-like signal output (HDOD) protein
MEYTIEEVLTKVEQDLPSLSPTSAKVTELANDMNCPPGELTRVIKLDPVLSMKVMKLVNSSYFTTTTKIVNLEKAIIMLGLNTIKNLALSAAMLGQFEGESASQDVFDMNDFWTHSLAVGVTAKGIAAKRGVDKKTIEDYFIAGLGHTFGLLIEAFFYPEEMQEVIEMSPSMGIIAAEEYALCGLNHCSIGKALAEKWGLPDNLAAVMENHHDQNYDGEYKELVLTVCLADIICKNNNIGLTLDKSNLQVEDVLLDALGVSIDIEKDILNSIKGEVQKAMEFLKI